MKQILLIITVIVLFIASGLIFWAGLSPVSFSMFFAVYPLITETARQSGVLNIEQKVLPQATATDISDMSEPILGTSGQVVINNNVWKVEIAKDDASRVNGLSNRSELRRNQGLLFAFDKMEAQNFWMKDMLLPIDMVFIDNNWRIVLIESNLQSNTFPKTFGSSVKSQYVLEINALEANTYGLKVGDQVVFTNK